MPMQIDGEAAGQVSAFVLAGPVEQSRPPRCTDAGHREGKAHGRADQGDANADRKQLKEQRHTK